MKNRKYKERTGWECPTWRLRVIDFPSADGSIKERGVIDHPGSVVIVPLMGDEVMILNQHRIALDSTILELPAGTRDLGEEWLVTAQRELREETGFKAEDWVSLGLVWPAPGITNELMAVYLARGLSAAPLPPDMDEEIEVKSHSFAELILMALDGRLQDAKSVVAILRAADYLGKIHASSA